MIDLGPKAGPHGGEVVYSVDNLYDAPTPTGAFVKHQLPLKTEPRRPAGKLRVADANTNNLKNVTVDIPTGVLTVVTGVAGPGKSSLINDEFLKLYPESVVRDQAAVGISRRSPSEFRAAPAVRPGTGGPGQDVSGGKFLRSSPKISSRHGLVRLPG